MRAASNSCDFLTGATLVVDGGQMIIAPKFTAAR